MKNEKNTPENVVNENSKLPNPIDIVYHLGYWLNMALVAGSVISKQMSENAVSQPEPSTESEVSDNEPENV